LALQAYRVAANTASKLGYVVPVDEHVRAMVTLPPIHPLELLPIK